MPEPESVADLQQFLSALQWMNSTMPHYSKETSKLREALNHMIKDIGSCKKRRLQRKSLSQYKMYWTKQMKLEFQRIKLLLMKAMRLAYLDENKELRVFPDASTTHWGLFVSQIPAEDLRLPFEKQLWKFSRRNTNP